MHIIWLSVDTGEREWHLRIAGKLFLNKLALALQ